MKLFLLIALFIPQVILAQVKDIQKVIETPGISKSELYKRAQYYFAKEFKSAKDVVQLKEEGDGKIIGKGTLRYYAPAFNPGTNYSGWFEFTLTIDVKDGKYRYLIDQIRHISDISALYQVPDLYSQKIRRRHNRIVTDAQRYLDALCSDIENGMAKPYKDDNW